MKSILSSRAVLFCAAALLATGAFAQEMQGVTVEASRIEQTEIRSPGISSEFLLRASYRVSYGDLDLATSEGRVELGRRIDEAARLACREIEREYPFSTPAHEQCVRDAVGEATSQIRPLVAAR